MRTILPVLLLLTPVLPAAEELTGPPPKKKFSAISLLPNGSEMTGVMLPRYDENQNLVGVLKASLITLINEETMAGKNVSIGFYNRDQTPRGHVDLTQAVFNQARGTLETIEPVTIQSDRLRAKGTGLYYAFEQGEGFLTGPAATWIQPPTETTMNSHPSPLRATAMVGLSLIAQSIAATPPTITQEAKEAIQADAASAASIHADTARVARMDLASDLEASNAANARAQAFLKQAELISTTSPGKAPAPPAAAPLDVKPGPTDTLIECDGGMYFDADQGLFVYLKNVRVNDPRFTLTGANELKIFLSKKPEDKEPEPDTDKTSKPGLGIGADFGDVERIIATGAVRILQKEAEPGKEPVEASGAIFTYRPDTGQIVLSGGYPWVKQGTNFMRAKEPNLILRIQKSGSFVTEGNWGMGANIENR